MAESSHVPAAENTLRILSLLASSRGPLQASMIATMLDLPRSSVYHLLNVLERNGYVMHLAEEKRFGLGIAAVELSSAYARQEPLSRVGRTVLANLVDRTGLSAHLAVLHGRDVLYIVEERARNAPSLITGVDVRLPSYLTASGRAILAALPRAQVRALYPDAASFVQRHNESEGIERYSQLRSILDSVDTRGFASENGEVTPGFSSVAVPVRDHLGWPVAGLAVTFREEEVPAERRADLAEAVRHTADELTKRIYGRTA